MLVRSFVCVLCSNEIGNSYHQAPEFDGYQHRHGREKDGHHGVPEGWEAARNHQRGNQMKLDMSSTDKRFSYANLQETN